MEEGGDERVRKIPLLSVNAGPRDGDEWAKRLKVGLLLVSRSPVLLVLVQQEEYKALIEYVKMNKENNTDWFKLEANKQGTRWYV
jgi:ufm1-conjugating enzyme 1